MRTERPNAQHQLSSSSHPSHSSSETQRSSYLQSLQPEKENYSSPAGGGLFDHEYLHRDMETVVGDLMATELRLGLPGTVDDCSLQTGQVKATPPSTPRGKKRAITDAVDAAAAGEEEANKRGADAAAPPAAKAPVVGWPPVRSYRKSCFQQASISKQQVSSKQAGTNNKEEAAAAPTSCTAPSAAAAAAGSFVKVSMDGAPYLRKVDLRMYKGYRELREALEAMFVSSNSGSANLSEFAVTYEDKDGDLMLVGDVPFEMFTSTCKKLRIMKRSEATGLGSARQ